MILESVNNVIANKDGAKLIVAKFNSLYKKNELHEIIQDIKAFGSYKRASDTNIQKILITFNQRYHKFERPQTAITKDLIGFKLLKAAKLSSDPNSL